MAAFQCKFSVYIVFIAALGFTCDGQQFYVKHAPSYIIVKPESQILRVRSSDLHDVLAGPLGLNNQESIFKSKSVLRRPKANILFTVVTHKDQNLPVDSIASFPVDWNVPYVNIDHLTDTVQSKFLDRDTISLDFVSSNQFFDIKTSSPMFQSLPTSFDSARERLLDADSFLSRLSPSSQKSSLNSSRSSDAGLLAELQMVDDIITTLKNNAEKLNTKTPDLLSFTLSGLQDVCEDHGVDSEQTKDAQNIFTAHLNQITEKLKSLYDGQVIVGILIVPYVDQANVRKTRSLMQAEPNSTLTAASLNLEIDWYGDFPAVFNIVLWLMIILLITVFFVAYGIWNVNPNLESILYRVPQDDLKKNN